MSTLIPLKTIGILIGLLLIGVVSFFVRNPHGFSASATSSQRPPSSQEFSSKKTSTSPKVWVHLAGWIQHPGIYAVTPNQRIVDVLSVAGGVREGANLDALNLVARVKDGQRILVKPIPSLANKSSLSPSLICVNLNTASEETIAQVPGMGKKMATHILAYRNKNGRISAEDFLKIKGLGGKKGKKILETVCF